MCSVGAGFHVPAGVWLLVGAVSLDSGWVQCLESVPGVDDVVGEGPAGWDLQDFLAGVGDVAGGGAQEPVAQGFGFGSGQLPIEDEVT